MSETSPSPAPSPTPDEAHPFNWRAELKGIAVMLALVLAFHSLVAKPFYIPSSSMLPNLWVGDRLIVSKYPYGWNWASPSFHVLPRGGWRIAPRTPEYGDIVIVVPRGHPDEDYIKRVVALPGDRIAVKKGQIILNGRPVPQTIEPPVDIPLDAIASAEEPFPCTGYGYAGMLIRTPAGTHACEMPVLRETMPNGASYPILEYVDRPSDHMAEIRVPEGQVFLMGDNRDNSDDSRYPLAQGGLGGPVPISDIGGRAEFTTFSLDGSATRSPISWLGALRKHRAWRTLRPPIESGPFRGGKTP